LLDLAGPADVFSAANLFAPDGSGYELEVVSLQGDAVRAHGGIVMHAGKALCDIAGPIDTLMVVGGLPAAKRTSDRDLVGQIAGWRRRPAGSRRCAAAPSCWPRRDWSTAGAPPRTGSRPPIWPADTRLIRVEVALAPFGCMVVVLPVIRASRADRTRVGGQA
jgi:hypothetical protein